MSHSRDHQHLYEAHWPPPPDPAGPEMGHLVPIPTPALAICPLAKAPISSHPSHPVSPQALSMCPSKYLSNLSPFL